MVAEVFLVRNKKQAWDSGKETHPHSFCREATSMAREGSGLRLLLLGTSPKSMAFSRRKDSSEPLYQLEFCPSDCWGEYTNRLQ